MRRLAFGLVALVAMGAAAQTVRERPLATRDSFRIGDSGALCTAQYAPLDSEAASIFDRAYAIVCRDAATTVGKLYALRSTVPDPAAAFLKRHEDLECAAPVAAAIDGVAGARLAECTRRADGLPHRVYFAVGRNLLYVADGLRGYDSALTLGLRSLVANRVVTGAVEVAVTEAGDPNAFARIQAGVLNPDSAAAEGLGRNNAGSYAEAAEFFERLLVDNRTTSSGGATETLLNYGLQQSNLSNFPVAEDSFDQAERRGAGGDPVTSRLLRNYRAIDQMNQRNPASAIKALDAAVAPVTAGSEELANGRITAELAERINRAGASNRRFGNNGRLTPVERAQILDGQGALLRGTALRRLRKYPEALTALDNSKSMLVAVRGGRIPSTAFLRSEALAQTSLISETRGDHAGAIRNLEQSMQLVQTAYPGTATAMSTKARLAAALLRANQQDRALALYAEIVKEGPSVPGGTIALNVTLRPYLAALAARSDRDPEAVGALFAASQLFVRPGLSQTQAVLARELSGGSDAASQLFRESLNRSREVARATGDVADLAALNPVDGSKDAETLARARERLAALEKEQVALQSQLAAYPRYRVLNSSTVTLVDLQKGLRPGEGYYELRYVGPDVYAIFVTVDGARAFKVAGTAKALDAQVAELRSTIVRTERGRVVTEPYDIALARKLYLTLFGPVDEQVRGLKHLIWEADGGLLSLPPNVLVADQASVDRYEARMKKPDADPFDFRGTAWLGRDRDVSTAVSVRGFLDVRATTRSPAPRVYFGFGNNALPAATQMPAALTILAPGRSRHGRNRSRQPSSLQPVGCSARQTAP